MRSWRFVMVAALVALAINAAPLVQIAKTGGALYYRNGDGEPAYLQHDFSVRTQSLSRFGQWPVSLLHEAGLSAGWINFAFDLTLPLVFLCLVRALGGALGFGERSSTQLAMMVTLGPLLATGANPIVRELVDRAMASGIIQWVALTDSAFLPLARTPEPQVSLVLLALAALVSARKRSLWPLWLVLPFLYTFLALPAAFVVTALQMLALARRFGERTDAARTGLVCALAWVALSLGAIAMLKVAVPPPVRQFLVPAHAPMLSLHSGLSLVALVVFRESIRVDLRNAALILALAPLAAVNLQVFTGCLVAPIAVELYGGTLCLAAVLGLAVTAPAPAPRFGPASRIILASALLLFSVTCARTVLLVLETPIVEEEVIDALRRDASRVATSDGHLARLLGMVLPLQKATALDFIQTDPKADPDATFPRYLSDRAAILADPRRRAEFARVISALDAGYAHRNEDAVYATSGRAKAYWTNVDVDAEAARWPGRSRDLVFVAVRNGRVVLDP